MRCRKPFVGVEGEIPYKVQPGFDELAQDSATPNVALKVGPCLHK